MVLKKQEMLSITGGAGLSATMLNSIIRGFTLLFDLGKSVGTAISRAINKNYC